MAPVRAHIRAVADALERRVPELARDIATRIRDQVEELPDPDTAQLQQVLTELSRSSVATELGYLRRGEQPDTCPPDAAESARLAAMASVSELAMLRTQRIGHAVVWDAYVEEVERLGVESPLRREVLEAGSKFFFEYADHLARFTVDARRRESERSRQSTDRRRLRAVIDLIEGRSQDARELDYDLTLEHLGAIAWGERPVEGLRTLAQLLERRLFWVSATDHAVWGWLGSSLPRTDVEARALARLEPGDSFVALGEPGPGLEGFRRTHLQAHEAHRVALRRPRSVTRYSEVALEALAIRDERTAREFVSMELGALGDGDRAKALRETLRAYFGCGQNAAATGAALGVHEQTVAQRLRVVEDRIGRSVNSRRAELEMALRIESLLDG